MIPGPIPSHTMPCTAAHPSLISSCKLGAPYGHRCLPTVRSHKRVETEMGNICVVARTFHATRTTGPVNVVPTSLMLLKSCPHSLFEIGAFLWLIQLFWVLLCVIHQSLDDCIITAGMLEQCIVCICPGSCSPLSLCLCLSLCLRGWGCCRGRFGLCSAARSGSSSFCLGGFCLGFCLGFSLCCWTCCLGSWGGGCCGCFGCFCCFTNLGNLCTAAAALGLGFKFRGGAAEPDEVAPDAFNLLSFFAVFLVFLVPVLLGEEDAPFPFFFFFLSPLPLHPFFFDFPFPFFLPFAFPSPRARFLADFEVS